MSFLKKICKLKSFIQCGGYNEIKIANISYPNILNDRNVLITGGGSGIGYEIAKKCVHCGANVIITGRNRDKLVNAVQEFHGKMRYIVWDITDVSIINKRLEEVKKIFDGNIDYLVNNAGVEPMQFFPNVDELEWNRIYETNSKGLFFLTQAICQQWMANKTDYYRKIINIDSQGGFVGATYPYRMTKWDVRGFTQGLGLKMAQYGVLVNGIAPGVVKTEMQEFALKQGENTFCNQNLLQRVELPIEVAELTVFLLSDACNFIVGQTILVDGGFSLK